MRDQLIEHLFWLAVYGCSVLAIVTWCAPALHAALCAFDKCWRCQTYQDDTGIWGQCIDCGKRHGFVSREELRAYIDRVERK